MSVATAQELAAAEVRLPLLTIFQLWRERDVASDESALRAMIMDELERRAADD